MIAELAIENLEGREETRKRMYLFSRENNLECDLVEKMNESLRFCNKHFFCVIFHLQLRVRLQSNFSRFLTTSLNLNLLPFVIFSTFIWEIVKASPNISMVTRTLESILPQDVAKLLLKCYQRHEMHIKTIRNSSLMLSARRYEQL